METITIFYVVIFSYFFLRVSEVFAQAYNMHILRFLPLDFFEDNIHYM
jgi:hypothetical protein